VLGGGAVLRLQELYAQGLSLRAIARRTGYDRKTIRKWLKQGGVPRPVPHRRGGPRCCPLFVWFGTHGCRPRAFQSRNACRSSDFTSSGIVSSGSLPKA